MLCKLIHNMVSSLPVTLREAAVLIKYNTKQMYLCEPCSSYNAKLVFITGEEVQVKVTTLFVDKDERTTVP